jgi:hypothetical protein
MNLGTQSHPALAYGIPAAPESDPGLPGFLSLRESAALEFQASVQLLAERARFLTRADGVAVALKQGGQFVYCAAAGDSAPETGTTADVTRHPLGECIQTGRAVRLVVERISDEAASEGSHLAVPLLRDGEVAGFLELLPGVCTFEDADIETATRLSAMVSTALDHLEAAENTDSLISELKQTPPPAGPVLWHAPEGAPEPAAADSHPSIPVELHACTSCGFPVSGGRSRCVDCEERHQDTPALDPRRSAEMFAPGNQESWISAHGYTIASLLVTALTAAIIYWLR